MLGVSAQADALFQVVHVQQVVFPLLIDDAEHQHTLVIAHGLGAKQFFFGLVAFA